MSFLASCTTGGCGAKIGPGELGKVLSGLPDFSDPNLLVGFDGSDDASVYQISDDKAIVGTLDFFTPMVDDPRSFGRIAATNAMSDIYAMGGKVLFALNIVCFPRKMDSAILGEILAGGAEKILEAGAVLSGGHSIYDEEPKYGLSVTGEVHPNKIIRNNTPQTGDVLILTKALGVGLTMSAMRGEMASEEAIDEAVRSMERLNKYAAEQMADYPVHACTDITGFGLLVHASEMAGDKHTLVIDSGAVPCFKEAAHFAEEYLITAAGQRNRKYLEGKIDLEGIPFTLQEIFFDPQTSGGLLMSVPAGVGTELLEKIKQDDPVAAIIGVVEEYQGKNIQLV